MHVNNSDIGSIDFLPSNTSQQVRQVPSYIRNQCQCELCAYQYDLENRVPMMLCDSQHHCCLTCVNEIIIRKKQCPFCRKDIQIKSIKKNRMICKILQQVFKKQGITYRVNQNPQKMIKSGNSSLILAPDYIPPYILDPPNQHDIQILLAPLLHPPPPQNQSLCSKICERLQFGDSLFCIVYFLIMVYLLPFFVCELVYAFTLEQQQCVDNDNGVGMSLRTWLLSSGIVGLSMYTAQLGVMVWKVCLPNKKKFPQVVSVINLICFVLKFLGYNILGIVVYENINQNDLQNCDGSIQAYMEAIFIIEIVVFSGLCAILDRR